MESTPFLFNRRREIMLKSNRFQKPIRVSILVGLIALVLTAAPLHWAGARTESAPESAEWAPTGGPWDASGDARLFAIDADVEYTVYAVVESSGVSTLYRSADNGATWTSLWMIGERLGALVARGGVLYAGMDSAAPGDDAILRSVDSGVTWASVMTATSATTVNSLDLLPSPSTGVYAAAEVGSTGIVLSSTHGLDWTAVYSIPGRMMRVSVNPVDPARAYASGQNTSTNSAEVYRTSNCGSDWETALSVSGEEAQDFLQVHPVFPDRVFVTTRPPGCCPPESANLWRSVNGGTNWITVTTGYLFKLYFATPDSIYSIYDTVSVTHDASSISPTWLDRGVQFSEWPHGRAVDARPANPVIYAGLAVSGIFTSTDDALSFREANNGIHSLLKANALVTDPRAENTLYAATDKGLFRSDTSGATWSPISLRIITRDVAIRPGDSNVLLATVENDPKLSLSALPLLYRSQNGGQTWDLVYSLPDEPGRTHGAYGVSFDPSDPNLAFATTGASTPAQESNNHLLRSGDGGQTWEEIMLTHGQWPGVVQVQVASDGTVYYGGKEGFEGAGRAILYRSGDHGDTWAEVYTHDNGWRVLSVAIDPQFPGRLVMIVAENLGATHLLQSHDRGDTWQELDPGPAALASVTQPGNISSLLQNLKEVTYDPLASGRVFLSASGPVILVSRDDGQAWSELTGWGNQLAAPDISALAVSHAAQERMLFAGLSGTGLTGVWRHPVPLYLAFLPLVLK
jgi:photosystem II stability/assembly factor-like uncharacterized protein